jgi:hypothetical protein
LQELIADPGGREWANPELEDRLRQRLPKSYDIYLESIDHIKEVMIELKRELGVDKAGFQSRLLEHNVSTLLLFISSHNKLLTSTNV